MYLIEKEQNFKNKVKLKSYRKNLDEVAIYCVEQIQKFFTPALKKLNADTLARIDTNDEHIQMTFLVVIDGEVTLELFVVDKTAEALQEFMNYRCEDYRIYAHYKFKKTK